MKWERRDQRNDKQKSYHDHIWAKPGYQHLGLGKHDMNLENNESFDRMGKNRSKLGEMLMCCIHLYYIQKNF